MLFKPMKSTRSEICLEPMLAIIMLLCAGEETIANLVLGMSPEAVVMHHIADV